MVCLAVCSAVFLPERAVLMIFCPPSRTGWISGSPGSAGLRTAWAGVYLPCPPAYPRRAGAGDAVSPPFPAWRTEPFPTRWASARFMAAVLPRSCMNSCLPCTSAWGGCSGADAGWLWMYTSLVLMDSLLAGCPLPGGGSAVLWSVGAPVAASLVLIFGGSDLTRGAGSTSAGISWAAASLVLTCGGSDPACGADGTSGRRS